MTSTSRPHSGDHLDGMEQKKQKVASSESKVLGEGKRLRIVDFRMKPGGSEKIVHEFPTLRWEVVSNDATPLPEPVFSEAGASHCVENKSEVDYREIVWELLAGSKPQHCDEEIAKLEKDSKHIPFIGTANNFENYLLRAVELRLAPGAGDPNDFHQHCLDYGLCFVGNRTQISLWQPGKDGKAELNMDCDLEDGHAQVKPMQRGGFEEAVGKPLVYAMHQVTNRSKDSWVRCYQVEVK